jgi:ATP-dependent Clp protease protease subunit
MARSKMKAQFKAALQPSGVLEILIYEDIGYDWWSDGGVTAKTVKQAMDGAQGFDSITLRINSPGGDAFEGAAIYSLLRASGKPINVFIDGIAASAASIIAMAGDTITMSNVAMMMVHNAWTVCAGDAGDMRKCADTLEKVSASIAQAYVARTGKTAAAIKDIMDEETWMGAQECVDQGFATAVAAPEEKDEAAMALASSFRTLAKMKKVPEKLKASVGACGCSCAACVDGDCGDCTNDDCEFEDCDHGADMGATEAPEANNLSQYEARLKLLRK